VRAPLVFVDDLDAPRLTDDDAHHLRRVLRLRDDDTVTIADGHGAWRPAVLGSDAAPVPTGDVVVEPEPAPPITIAFAIVKGDKPETVVQKLTELGADRIVPFVAARSVVRWDDDKARRNVERLRKVVREAAMQCRRARLPQVDAVVPFSQLVRVLEPASGGLALADFDGGAPTLAHPTIAIGPEGGWTDEERAAVPTKVVLGPHVLRAETAAITACALLAAQRASLVPGDGHVAAG
jgi:16S rRNA (uracil1498-N3)-methyltransferase